jgi:hypothetical protein
VAHLAERAALVHWAAYVVLSSINWALLALNLPSRPLPAVLIGVRSAISLRRGIRLQPAGI